MARIDLLRSIDRTDATSKNAFLTACHCRSVLAAARVGLDTRLESRLERLYGSLHLIFGENSCTSYFVK